MKNGNSHQHVSVDRLQAFLDGELPDDESARVEAHLAGCTRCSAEFEAWRVLFDDLGTLASHRPHEGFRDRVMLNVDVPGPVPLAARVKAALAVAMPASLAGHLEDALLQDFLDGELSPTRTARVEAHLTRCESCSAEAQSWLGLIGRLEALRHFAPDGGFADRVIAATTLPGRVSTGARARLAGLLPERGAGHLGSSGLQDFVDGALSGRRLRRAQRHLAACSSCADEAEEWRELLGRVAALPAFQPRDGFAGRVMASVRVDTGVVATAASLPSWRRSLASAKRLVPQTRQAWAVISGVAVTPAVTFGLVLYVLASHPTLTLDGLASFAWWQLSDLVAAGWTVLATAVFESGGVSSLSAFVDALASAPLVFAGGGLAYSAGCALALRVLYKNLFARRPMDGRYAHVSAT